jgi:hypothetical protein
MWKTMGKHALNPTKPRDTLTDCLIDLGYAAFRLNNGTA